MRSYMNEKELDNKSLKPLLLKAMKAMKKAIPYVSGTRARIDLAKNFTEILKQYKKIGGQIE